MRSDKRGKRCRPRKTVTQGESRIDPSSRVRARARAREIIEEFPLWRNADYPKSVNGPFRRSIGDTLIGFKSDGFPGWAKSD
jgi:hypothetical protein